MAGAEPPPAALQQAPILRPILLVWLAAVLVLTVTGSYLVQQFDHSSRLREESMVTHGLEQRISEIGASIVPQVNWDEAVLHIDKQLDRDWIDKNLATYLRTMADISHVFVIHNAGQAHYAATQGKRAALSAYQPFAQTVAGLLPAIRAAEAARPPLRASHKDGEMSSTPIQTATVARIDNRPYIIIATLVQPDFGTVLPRMSGAAVVVVARPIDQALLTSFGSRYLISDMHVGGNDPAADKPATIDLFNAQGHRAGILSWSPRRPGLDLVSRILPAMGILVVLIAIITWILVRRNTMISTDLIASEARARHLAYHDALTTLPNRAMMFDRLDDQIARSRRQFSQTAVHCLDLDRLKDVNDTLGHHAGDELIRQVAQRLCALCRQVDTVARLGGDEFVILQPDTSASGASHLAERILKSFEEPFELQFGVVEVGISIGVALIATPDIDPSEALRQADLALYRSKEAGRNRITFFEPDMDAALRMRRAMEADLRHALTEGALTMVYQPQVDEHGRIISTEALVRWHHPQRGAVSPAIFVPLAEESGLILDLGEFVLRRVFAETANWQDTQIAVNVSALQLRSPVFMAMLTRLVAEFGIDPARYEIEITETALLGNDGITSDNLTMLKQEGFAIALDDFGTGYSCLNSLKRFSVDKIKIDRSFIQNLAADPEAEALVDAIIRLARALKVDIVAEGVETETQRQKLLACGCYHFQGYLFSYPVPAEDFRLLLAA